MRSYQGDESGWHLGNPRSDCGGKADGRRYRLGDITAGKPGGDTELRVERLQALQGALLGIFSREEPPARIRARAEGRPRARAGAHWVARHTPGADEGDVGRSGSDGIVSPRVLAERLSAPANHHCRRAAQGKAVSRCPRNYLRLYRRREHATEGEQASLI
jgi:hypothetical protein